MHEPEQDLFLAEWVVDGYEGGEGKHVYAWALSVV